MSRPLRVLVIEHSEDDAAVMIRELRQADYEPIARRVDSVAGLEDALHSPWDVALCGWRTLELEAANALAMIQSRQAQTPCIIVSDTFGEEEAANALRSGARDLVSKGNLSTLAPTVERELRDSEVRVKRALEEPTPLLEGESMRSFSELVPDSILAVSTLAAGVAHEINNPLAYVMANIAYAADEIARAQRQLEQLTGQVSSVGHVATALSEVAIILGEVDEGARRIRDIARDLSTFARNDKVHRLDLRAVADSALRMAAPEIRLRARVVRQYEETPSVRANASQVSQVLWNLIVRAAHAIPNGAYEANEIAVRIRSTGENVVVEISDTGCGIAPEDQERLLSPSFTSMPEVRGAGLGLAVSRRIVRSLGGDIQLESAPGRGTTARLILPAARDVAPDPALKPVAPARRARLLFVDDERLVGTAFQRALSREHDVVVVETASDALARLRTGESFDAVFCDVNMPRMTGVDFFEVIESTMPQLAARTVLITGGADDSRTTDFATTHGVPLLEKPLDMSRVRMFLAQLLAR